MPSLTPSLGMLSFGSRLKFTKLQVPVQVPVQLVVPVQEDETKLAVVVVPVQVDEAAKNRRVSRHIGD